MMYRCRIISIFLSLAIITSLFSFSVSADSLPFFQIVWGYSDDGSNWTSIYSDANDGVIADIISDKHLYWRIEGLRFYHGHTDQSEFMMAFSVAGACSPTINNPDDGAHKLTAQNYSGQKKGVVYTSIGGQVTTNASYFMYGVTGNVPFPSSDYYISGQAWVSSFVPTENGFTFYVRLKSNLSTDGNAQTYFALNAPPVFRSYSWIQGGSSTYETFKPLLYNCTYFENLNVLLNSLFDETNSYLNTIDLHNQAWYSYWTSPYYYPLVDYQNNTVSQTSGNFWQSITGYLKVITDKITYQISQSNQYGQMDGFEAGMSDIESAGGIGNITDFNSIIGASTWSSSSYGSQSYDGLSHWFSQPNHDAIQAEIKHKSDDGFVDYTDQLYQAYINALNPTRLILDGKGEEDDDTTTD